MFQLTKVEFDNILKSKKSASSWGGRRKLPNAFTEQGIYMLMTILNGDLAFKQSKSLVRLTVSKWVNGNKVVSNLWYKSGILFFYLRMLHICGIHLFIINA